MKNSIEELISCLDKERTQCFRLIDDMSVNDEKLQDFILVGKILAYNFCLEKLACLIQSDLKSMEYKNEIWNYNTSNKVYSNSLL